MTSIENSPSARPVRAEDVNLRKWFGAFLAWLVILTVAARWGLGEVDAGGSTTGWALWMLAGYAFYMSLCCTFFPAPTAWMVLLVASDMAATQVGVEDHGLARLIVVATVGAMGTALANLNEYHIFTYLLSKRRVAKIRQTHFFQTAKTWFAASSFWIVALFSFIPLPVDVVRWLAIFARYPRARFFAACFVGRWFRYALLATAAVGLNLTTRHIVIVQIVLVGLALTRIALRLLRQSPSPDGGYSQDAVGVDSDGGNPVAPPDDERPRDVTLPRQDAASVHTFTPTVTSATPSIGAARKPPAVAGCPGSA